MAMVSGNKARESTAGRSYLMLHAARRFFVEGASRSKIAEELGISRFRVTNLIEQARRLDYVSIHLARPDGLDIDRSERLVETGLVQRAIVTPARLEGDDIQTLVQAATSYISEKASEDDVIGMSPGRTTHLAARWMQRLTCAAIVQTTGVIRTSLIDASPIEVLRILAELSNAESFPLYAPGLVSSEAVADVIRQEPTISSTISKYPDITMLLVRIAAWDEESAFYSSLDRSGAGQLKENGARAEILGSIFDEEGNSILADFTQRCITVPTPILRSVPDVIAIGEGDMGAVLSVVRSGIVGTLIVTSNTADYLLKKLL